MHLNRQFLCQTVLACAALAPFAALHAQSMPNATAPGMDGSMPPRGPAKEDMHRMHGMGGMDRMEGREGMTGHYGAGVGGMSGLGAMGAMGRMEGMEHHELAFLHGVDLDDAQSDQIYMIMHEQAPQLRMIRKARQRAERELNTLARSGEYNDAAARPMVEAIVKSTSDTAYLQARAQSRIVALLRPDQRARIAQSGIRSMIRPAPDNAAPR